MIIETYGYARAGFLGNPSDGYFGKTISFSVRNFRARVLLYPSARLEIKLSKADLPVFENLQDLYETTRWRGYYGGIRIIQALIIRFLDYCRQHEMGRVDKGSDGVGGEDEEQYALRPRNGVTWGQMAVSAR